jgi:hypothetical protein
LPQPYGREGDQEKPSSWRIALLPFIEQDDLYKQYKKSETWDGISNSQLATRMPRVFALHGDYKPGLTATNYLVIVGSKTAWQRDKRISLNDIKDGPSNTLAIVENRGLNIQWMEPRDLDFETMDWTIDSPRGISSKYHRPGAVFFDGSVRSLSTDFTPKALQALATIVDGDSATEDGDLVTEMRDGRDRPVTKP